MDKPKSTLNSAARVAPGDDFRRWRESKNLGLGQIAKQLGVSRTSVQRMDREGLTRTQALALAACMAGLEPINVNPETEDAP